ncbi:MAG: class I SAM-dependent methyltransferase [bacterium]|nr:class I SAM-dependent methyltransferase [bacterium]
MTCCRSCGAQRLDAVLFLGDQPLANSLPDAAGSQRKEPRYPLTLALCGECSLAQILETIPPEELFSDYLYFSSFSDTMLAHARESAEELIASQNLGTGNLVVEIASNDGYQLKFFKNAGVPVLGVEPAANIAAVAEEKGIPTRVEFFGTECATRLASEGRVADVLLAFNVMAHVPDLNGFVNGIQTLLGPDGVAVIEVPDVFHLLQGREFDTIYHEHLCYFSVSALRPLFARHDLQIFRVDELPIHGGSLRVYVAHKGARKVEPSVDRLDERDREHGLLDGSAYRELTRRVEKLREEVIGLVDSLRADGKRVAAYGAAAKGSTLLNYFGLGADRVDFVVDRSPHKQDRFMPGVGIPIHKPSRLRESQPDYCLLLTWNFADEILEQQDEYRRAGGKFIIPLPELRVV